MKRMRYLSFAALLLALLSFSGCGVSAASMHLRRAEGEVRVEDGEGKSLSIAENMGLYSGYNMGTATESFAWIDLDSVKLAKMDENSQAAIVKEGKALTVEMRSGSLFFNVTKPLADDETMEIRTSTMLVGIRGTCGWVTMPDPGHLELYLLEGTVECAAGAETAMVSAGEKALMSEDGTIEVSPLASGEIPDFVLDELTEDEALAEAVVVASGIDIHDDPRVTFADVLDELDEENEILYTEMVDFEGDGAPELLAAALADRYKDGGTHAGMADVGIYVYQDRPEGTVRLGVCSCWMFADDCHDGKVSLIESGGRLYVRLHSVYEGDTGTVYTTETDEFYGIDSNTGEWIRAERVEHTNSSYRGVEHTNYQRLNDPNGTRNKGTTGADYTNLLPDEYAALIGSYREIKTIAYTPDNASIAVAPAQ